MTFLESYAGQWFTVGFLFVLVTVLTAWVVMIERRRKEVLQKRRAKRPATKKATEAREFDWSLLEPDGWEHCFPTGKFIKSWYLDMDVLEEGVSELGSRYRILKDNETGVIYFYDRSGMSVLVKDYRRMRYA